MKGPVEALPPSDSLALVTGAAGFVGSHLVDRLLASGRHVRGVHFFSRFYEPGLKRSNLEKALSHRRFELVNADAGSACVDDLVADAKTVYHLAGQPGVAGSWAAFPDYLHGNVVTTQRLLDAVRGTKVERFVLASSSSVYGDPVNHVSHEDDLAAPRNPYGLTKLSAELLCRAYATEWKVPTVALRYFTVYGPRQRPDMAVHRLLSSALEARAFRLRGDGTQRRAFTYVDDIVDATMSAAVADIEPGTVINVGSSDCVSLADVIAVVQALSGRDVEIVQSEAGLGEVHRTAACTERARQLLGWHPSTSLRRGVLAQMTWHLERTPVSSGAGPGSAAPGMQPARRDRPSARLG